MYDVRTCNDSVAMYSLSHHDADPVHVLKTNDYFSGDKESVSSSMKFDSSVDSETALQSDYKQC